VKTCGGPLGVLPTQKDKGQENTHANGPNRTRFGAEIHQAAGDALSPKFDLQISK
jgi:hypothetical protein